MPDPANENKDAETHSLAGINGHWFYTCLTGEYPSFYFTHKAREEADPSLVAAAKRKNTFVLFNVESLATLHLSLAAHMKEAA